MEIFNTIGNLFHGIIDNLPFCSVGILAGAAIGVGMWGKAMHKAKKEKGIKEIPAEKVAPAVNLCTKSMMVGAVIGGVWGACFDVIDRVL